MRLKDGRLLFALFLTVVGLVVPVSLGVAYELGYISWRSTVVWLLVVLGYAGVSLSTSNA